MPDRGSFRFELAVMAVAVGLVIAGALYVNVFAESTPERIDRGAIALVDADRGNQVQTRPLPTTTTIPGPPIPTPGDCDSWADVFAWYGATDVELGFFFGRGITWRETRCGADTLNEATGDSGICQINPVHNRAGYFGGRQYGAGGWLLALHGLRTRQATASMAWAEACLTMYRVCGSGPWVPPYSCLNREYP